MGEGQPLADIAYKDGDRVRLVSRHGVDHTLRFAGIVAAIAKLSARTLVLDGEVGIYDEQLWSRFEWLREPDPSAVATPPLLMAFDLLSCCATSARGRCMIAVPGWRTSSPAANWCFRCAGLRRMASKRAPQVR
jgi:hypothetical protein